MRNSHTAASLYSGRDKVEDANGGTCKALLLLSFLSIRLPQCALRLLDTDHTLFAHASRAEELHCEELHRELRWNTIECQVVRRPGGYKRPSFLAFVFLISAQITKKSHSVYLVQLAHCAQLVQGESTGREHRQRVQAESTGQSKCGRAHTVGWHRAVEPTAAYLQLSLL